MIGPSKYQLLQLFSSSLVKQNPMSLNVDNPLEYESEALSILSRFNEAALQVSGESDEYATKIATALVKQAFEFWFNDLEKFNPEQIAIELLQIYRSAHGQQKSSVNTVNKPVKSVTIG
jgi:sulfite reductase alpha subunit-like flavoprotein